MVNDATWGILSENFSMDNSSYKKFNVAVVSN